MERKKKKDISNILKLPEECVNGTGEKVTIEHNHFIIQCYRIPIKNKPNFRKIMQIALNSGQLRVHLSQKYFNKAILNTYKDKNMNLLSSYILKKDYKIFDTIPDKFIKNIENILMRQI